MKKKREDGGAVADSAMIRECELWRLHAAGAKQTLIDISVATAGQSSITRSCSFFDSLLSKCTIPSILNSSGGLNSISRRHGCRARMNRISTSLSADADAEGARNSHLHGVPSIIQSRCQHRLTSQACTTGGGRGRRGTSGGETWLRMLLMITVWAATLICVTGE